MPSCPMRAVIPVPWSPVLAQWMRDMLPMLEGLAMSERGRSKDTATLSYKMLPNPPSNLQQGLELTVSSPRSYSPRSRHNTRCASSIQLSHRHPALPSLTPTRISPSKLQPSLQALSEPQTIVPLRQPQRRAFPDSELHSRTVTADEPTDPGDRRPGPYRPRPVALHRRLSPRFPRPAGVSAGCRVHGAAVGPSRW